jgi:hypothetical protein
MIWLFPRGKSVSTSELVVAGPILENRRFLLKSHMFGVSEISYHTAHLLLKDWGRSSIQARIDLEADIPIWLCDTLVIEGL